MIDWLAISIALTIIAALVGIFGLVAWKINMSDPLMSADIMGKKEDSNQTLDISNDKRKREKSGNDTTKRKRKDKKKAKRGSKEEEEEEAERDDPHEHKVKFKEPFIQSSEDADNEREESEQDSSTATPPVVETSSKVRKRNKNKGNSSTHIEGILVNKDEKSPVTAQAVPMPHPILATTIPKDEVELAKHHNHPGKPHTKSSQPPAKQTASASTVPIKKTTPPSTNNTQGIQKQQQSQEQPFTTVGGNRHKTATPSTQQNKPVNTTTSPTTNVSANVPVAVTAAAPIPQVQQTTPVQVQQQPLSQRQKTEKPSQLNGLNANQVPIKQSSAVVASLPTKIADIVKTLPTSQTVVTELMLALDAVSLSTDELDIIMHKIANKQSVLKKDWTKLQHGQKVDPQAHIGQILDESARAIDEDMKNNAMKRIHELTDERNTDKRRINDLLKETSEKDRDIQVLHAQLSTLQQPQQQFQTFQVDFKRLTEENMQLKQRLTQQQQHFQQQQQQQQFAPLGVMNNNADSSNIQLRVLSDQVKKLSVDNGNLEKLLIAKDSLAKDLQKERDELYRSNQQLVQKAQENQKQSQHNEDKLLKELNESRTLNVNQLNEFKGHLEQLKLDNEKLRHDNVAQKESMETITFNNEEREKLEQEVKHLKQQLIEDNEQNKKKIEEVQTEYQSKENELRQEIEQLKKNIEQIQQDDSQRTEIAAKTAEINALRAELDDAKARNDAIRLELEDNVRQTQNQQKEVLIELLDQNVRTQLPNDNQDFNSWLSSFRQIMKSSIESTKQTLQNESTALKHENDQLLKNMKEIESQLKEIEQTVQSKEELLLSNLKNKDATLEAAVSENEQLTSEIRHLRTDFNHLQLAHDAATNEVQTLKIQLQEQTLLHNNISSTVGDDSLDTLHSNDSNSRLDQLNELIRSSKQALENQDSVVQQLDKHLNEIRRSGTGEGKTSKIDESTVSSSDQQQEQPQNSQS